MLAFSEILTAPSGPAALFIGSFLASTLLPGGSEAMLLFAVHQQPESQTQLWMIATLGNTLGGLSSWLIGWWLARRFPAKGLSNPRHQRALQQISNRGSPILLFSWLPVVGDPLCLAAGWSGVRLLPAALFIGCGKGLRYALMLGLLGV
ncbi:MAG: VTT domain-containing protein [Pseudomonadota bacterium]